MSSATSSLRSARGFRLQWEPAQKAHVLLYPEGMVKLNGSAGEILKRCDGERDGRRDRRGPRDGVRRDGSDERRRPRSLDWQSAQDSGWSCAE